MADVFVGSHEKPNNSYGQNGSAQGSSLTPGQTKPPIKDVSPSQIAVPGLRTEDTLGARVKMDGDKAASYAHHDGLPRRDSNSGSPGGEVPKSLGYRGK